MKDFFRHNRPAAIAALILVIALSLLIGVNRSVGRLANKVEDAYVSSDSKYGSVQKDLNKFYGYLNELLSVSMGYSDDIGLAGAVNDLQEALTDPFGTVNKMQSAYETAVITYNRLSNSEELTDSDSMSIKQCIAELQALTMRLKTNKDYNEAARKYNKVLDSFPANVLCFNKEPAAVYD